VQRVVVVGVTGAGKTTFAQALARQLGVPYVELDALHWGPNWTMPETKEFRARVAPATARPTWVIDGNYARVRDLVWGRADTLVWLDYALPLILWRLFWRTVRRANRRQELWNGNRESLAKAFLSRESLFLWALKTYPRNRATYPRALASPDYAHLRLVRLRNPGEATAWLASVDERASSPSQVYVQAPAGAMSDTIET
jgi:adenylate kinase family enzyme